MSERLRCSNCGNADFEPRRINYDVGPLLGMTEVLVENYPALVCPKCKAVSHVGEVLNEVEMTLAAFILQKGTIDQMEVRYLRKLLGYTQDEFAQKLGVERITVSRWENSEAPVSGPQALALRSYAFFKLWGKSRRIDALVGTFLEPNVPPKGKRGGYKLMGSDLRAAAR